MRHYSTIAMSFLLIIILFILILTHNCLAVENLHAPLLNTKTPIVSNFFLDPKNYNNTPPEEKFTSFWYNIAQNELNKRISYRVGNFEKAKNIILFLGDGMPLSTLTAARIYKGQLQNKTGEESQLFLETFPYVALSKTYCTNGQIADSACTATAYLCGVKTNLLTIGVNANVKYNDCDASMNVTNCVSSLAAWSQAAGKSTGIITTTTVTHASPSGNYAHVANRDWECDTDILKFGEPNTNIRKCDDIAKQLITHKPGSNFNVIMGGGMGKFLPENVIDAFGKAGERSDNMHLLRYWQAKHRKGVIVTNRNQLLDIDVKKVDSIFGQFASNSMTYNAFANKTLEPTLAEMTEKAIELLKKNKNGYFLFVEGGNIDTASHKNLAKLALDETLQFDDAVQVARKITSDRDTLIIVTSDHGHAMNINGYAGRGSPILGLNKQNTDSDGTEYMTLSYGAGPNQYLNPITAKQINLNGKIDAKDFIFPSKIPLPSGAHSGEDVVVYASGPQASLFSGLMEQNAIPHIMAYVAEIDKYKKNGVCPK